MRTFWIFYNFQKIPKIGGLGSNYPISPKCQNMEFHPQAPKILKILKIIQISEWSHRYAFNKPSTTFQSCSKLNLCLYTSRPQWNMLHIPRWKFHTPPGHLARVFLWFLKLLNCNLFVLLYTCLFLFLSYNHIMLLRRGVQCELCRTTGDGWRVGLGVLVLRKVTQYRGGDGANLLVFYCNPLNIMIMNLAIFRTLHCSSFAKFVTYYVFTACFQFWL